MKFSVTDYISEKELAEFCKKYHIKISLFGFTLRGELRPDSDINLLVEFKKDHPTGLITLAGTEIELTNMIGCPVDLREVYDLSYYFRDEVVNMAEVQYESE